MQKMDIQTRLSTSEKIFEDITESFLMSSQ